MQLSWTGTETQAHHKCGDAGHGREMSAFVIDSRIGVSETFELYKSEMGEGPLFAQ